MANFFMFTFLISIVCLILFLIKSRFRTKKFVLGAVIGIVASFILVGITAPAETQADIDRREKEEQVIKEEKERKAKKEQEGKEKAEKKEKEAKEEQEAKEKVEAEAEKKAKEEQEAKEKAEAERMAREEQEVIQRAEAERIAREEQEAIQRAEAEQRAIAEQEAAIQAEAAQQYNQNEASGSGITGYCKDGSVASGDPSARGKANSCYGHGGWVR